MSRRGKEPERFSGKQAYLGLSKTSPDATDDGKGEAFTKQPMTLKTCWGPSSSPHATSSLDRKGHPSLKDSADSKYKIKNADRKGDADENYAESNSVNKGEDTDEFPALYGKPPTKSRERFVRQNKGFSKNSKLSTIDMHRQLDNSRLRMRRQETWKYEPRDTRKIERVEVDSTAMKKQGLNRNNDIIPSKASQNFLPPGQEETVTDVKLSKSLPKTMVPRSERFKQCEWASTATGDTRIDLNSSNSNTSKFRDVRPKTKYFERNEYNTKGKTTSDPDKGSQTQIKSQRKTTRLKKLTYPALRKLREQDASIIALTLGCDDCCFEETMRESGSDFGKVSLLTSLLAKICISRSENNILKILVNVQSSSFLSHNIFAVLAKLPSERFQKVDDIAFFLEDLIQLLQELSLRMPHAFAPVSVGVSAVLESTAEQLREKLGKHYNDISPKLHNLKKMKENIIEQVAKENQKANLKSKTCKPPDDFRKINVMPQKSDLLPGTTPFLKKNRQVGGYYDVDEYLDTQFRLLREDFIQPLREGIEEYVNSIKVPGERYTIRVYSNVRFIRPVCSEDGILYRIKFNIRPLRRVDWRNSKRLNYGSLVCLSDDGFKTFSFATIMQNDKEWIEHGFVDIGFDDSFDKSLFSAEKDIVMVETPAYFEAYRHVLKGLQTITEDSMPFARYIVDCDTNIGSPQYLDQDKRSTYDLRSLSDKSPPERKQSVRELTEVRCCDDENDDNDEDDEDENEDGNDGNDDVDGDEDHDEQTSNRFIKDSWRPSEKRICSLKVPVFQNLQWPEAKQIGMNESQFKAFQTALTKEFAIIQGPPGTGKTFVGLKIAKALLKNRKLWDDGSKPNPMLIVCYTNHALDQFLEGIVKFFKGNLVRVGSRSQSELLKHCNMKVQKNELIRNQGIKEVDAETKEVIELRDAHWTGYVKCKETIEEFGRQIDAVSEGILHERSLRPLMKRHYENILHRFSKRKPRSAVMEWLGFGGIGRQSMTKKGLKSSNRQRNKLLPKESVLALETTDLDLEDKEWEEIYGKQLSLEERRRYKITIQQELNSDLIMTGDEAKRIVDVWNLNQEQRWRLYRHWIEQFSCHLKLMMEPLQAECTKAAAIYKEASAQIDKHLLSKASVIGMTTTGAARYQQVLAEIQPPIIIIEEAAEVLEGHVVTSLSAGCQHLILIGDHKQLRPNPNVYKLAKQYNLDISLFERMINNGLNCNCLQLQHRMRPAISNILRHIYPDLKDHGSVLSYDDVQGITENVFFINHSAPESHNQESLSHMNEFEANYVAALCRYLMKQGYALSYITVLSIYSAQITLLRRKLKAECEDGLKVTAVDNYQGEENGIILLSLVRSNLEGKIGFLNINNRICVALSRAKIGLYVIGNFKLLCEKSDTWNNIVSDLASKGCIGDGLKIFCRNHIKDHGIVAERAEDFLKAPEGGCWKPCQYRLKCGHVCALACHPYDPAHKEYKCRKPCTKSLCALKHPCPLDCFEKCNVCMVLLPKKIPHCGHIQKVPCYLHPASFKCEEPCTKTLSCGHTCGEKCGYPHKCREKVEKIWSCGHRAQVPCETKSVEKCPEECHDPLACQHECSGTCQGCNEGRLHKPCKEVCDRILVCGHQCKSTCSNCPPCTLPCENACSHSQCSKQCGKACIPCTEKCKWLCEHYRCTKLCKEECNRPRCDKPCKKKLPCKHECIGLCGESCPRYCRVCNKEDVTQILFGTEDNQDARFIHLEECGHIVEVTALDKWMEGDTASDGIQLKGCPWCKTTIRRNMRYGNCIKRILKYIEAVKKRQSGEPERKKRLTTQISQERDKLRSILGDLVFRRQFHVKSEVNSFLQDEKLLKNKSEKALATVLNQLQIIKNIVRVDINWQKMHLYSDTKLTVARDVFEKDLRVFASWASHSRLVFSDQEIKDAEMELARLQFNLFLLTYSKRAQTHKVILSDNLKLKLEKAKEGLTNRSPLTPEQMDHLKDLKRQVDDLLPKSRLGIEEDERIIIVKAMGMEKGHWFKCQNGHIYAIGDCGGAMLEAKCPECDAIIGGERHKLRTDNSVATEMDGATYSAWSEEANLNRNDFNV